MSDQPYASIGGVAVQDLSLYVPGFGAWFCDAKLVGDLDVSKPSTVTIKIGDAFIAVGTIDPNHSGSFALNQRVRIVAGANGWGAQLSSRAYRNDAGISALEIARDAAAEVGETIGTFAPGAGTIGTHYWRDAGVASRTLEKAAGGAAWWVDFAGITHVGAQPTASADPKNVRLLSWDATLNIATLAVDDLTGIGAGAGNAAGTVITDDRIDGPVTVTSYEIRVEAGEVRVIAWCDDGVQTHVADALRAIVSRLTDSKVYGPRRYRVVTIDPGPAGRLNLQAVNPSEGTPDMLSVPMHAAPGIHAKPALGSICYVEFVAGDPTDPIVTNFQGRGAPGFTPQALTIGADADSDAALVARQGDACEMIFPPLTIVGTIEGVGAFTGIAACSTGKLLGIITGGSAKNVKAG